MRNRLLLVIALTVLAMLLPTLALAADYYLIDDSDIRKLTANELEDYSLSDLGYIRNEILARHGFPFTTDKYKRYFNDQDWYYPDKSFAYDWLSETEMKNVELIKKLEKQRQDGDDDRDGEDDGDLYVDDYFIEDSDVRLLTRSALRDYTLSELGFIRNEILARHGYPFKTKKYKDYFDAMWWYTRDEDFDMNWLSSTEMKNVELIQKIEQERK